MGVCSGFELDQDLTISFHTDHSTDTRLTFWSLLAQGAFRPATHILESAVPHHPPTSAWKGFCCTIPVAEEIIQALDRAWVQFSALLHFCRDVQHSSLSILTCRRQILLHVFYSAVNRHMEGLKAQSWTSEINRSLGIKFQGETDQALRLEFSQELSTLEIIRCC